MDTLSIYQISQDMFIDIGIHRGGSVEPRERPRVRRVKAKVQVSKRSPIAFSKFYWNICVTKPLVRAGVRYISGQQCEEYSTCHQTILMYTWAEAFISHSIHL